MRQLADIMRQLADIYPADPDDLIDEEEPHKKKEYAMISMEQSLAWKVDTLAQQIEQECEFFRDEDDIHADLVGSLESFLAILQQQTGITDEQMKQAISDYCTIPDAKDLEKWNECAV